MKALMVVIALFYFGALQAQGIKGYLDGVGSSADGSAILWGWACDVGLARSIQVHVYLNGRAGSGTIYTHAEANLASEGAINAECGTIGISHRFSIKVPAADLLQHAGKTVFIHGIAANNQNLLLQNSGLFVLPVPPPIPPQPAAPTATVSRAGINVTWPDVFGATSFRVQQRINGGGWAAEMNLGTNRNYAIPAIPGQRYQFRVRACNATGCSAFSLPSQELTMGGITGYIDSVSALSDGGARISGWACDYGVAQSIPVHLYLGGAAPGGTYYAQQVTAQTTEVAINTACATHQIRHRFRFNLPPADVLRYEGKKIYIHGISSQFDNLTINRSGLFVVPKTGVIPAVPVAPNATAHGNQIQVIWAVQSGVSSYRLRQRVNNGEWQTEMDVHTALTQFFTGSTGSQYQYQLRACNINGCSAFSASSVAVTAGVMIAAPQIMPASGSFTSAVQVTLLSPVSGVVTRYTRNGDDVTQSSTPYTAPFTLTSSAVIKAKSFHPDMLDSPQSSANLQITIPVISVTYLHTDLLGSVIAETNEHGQVIKNTTYQPFGKSQDRP